MQNEVIFSEDNGVGIITLNRPDRLNALTYSMVDLINQNLSLWETNNDINCVVIEVRRSIVLCWWGCGKIKKRGFG